MAKKEINPEKEGLWFRRFESKKGQKKTGGAFASTPYFCAYGGVAHTCVKSPWVWSKYSNHWASRSIIMR